MRSTKIKKRIFGFTLDVISWLSFFAALLIALAVFFSTFTGTENGKSVFGYRLLIVNSDSMSRSEASAEESIFFETGDLIIVKEVNNFSDIAVGDVISFVSTNPDSVGQTLSHKVRSIKTTASGVLIGFETYGINTGVSDQALAEPSTVIGEYTTKIPDAGYAFNFLKKPAGYFTAILVPCLLLIIFFSIKVGKHIAKKEMNDELDDELESLKDRVSQLESEGINMNATSQETERTATSLEALEALEQAEAIEQAEATNDNIAPIPVCEPPCANQAEPQCAPQVAPQYVAPTEPQCAPQAAPQYVPQPCAQQVAAPVAEQTLFTDKPLDLTVKSLTNTIEILTRTIESLAVAAEKPVESLVRTVESLATSAKAAAPQPPTPPPMTQPVMPPMMQPMMYPMMQPMMYPMAYPMMQPMMQPMAQPAAQMQSMAQGATPPVTQPVTAPMAEPSVQTPPVTQPVTVPMAEPSVQTPPVVQPVASPAAEPAVQAPTTVQSAIPPVELSSYPEEPTEDIIGTQPAAPTAVEIEPQVQMGEDPPANGLPEILQQREKLPFNKRVLALSGEIKDYFSDIHNELVSHKKVKHRLSFKCISYRVGKNTVAKMAVKGKTLKLFLALDLNEQPESIFFQEDASGVKTFAEVPFAVKVKSNRGKNNALKLVRYLAEKNALVKDEQFKNEDILKELKALK